MDDDQLASELQRRASGASPRPDWAQRDLLPAVWREIDARPQPVLASRWSPLAGLATLVVAVLVLVVAVPRLVAQPPASTATPSGPSSIAAPSPSISPNPTIVPSPEAGTRGFTCAASGDPGMTIFDHTGRVTDCSMAQAGAAPDGSIEVAPTGQPNRLAISWRVNSGCPADEQLEFWGPVDQPLRLGPAHYVLQLARLIDRRFDPATCNDVVGVRQVEVGFTESVRPGDILAIVLAKSTSDNTVSSDASAGLFDLRLEAPLDGLLPNVPLDIASTLTYTDSGGPVTLSGSWRPDFEFLSLTGGPSLDPYGSILMCPQSEANLSPGDSASGRLEGPQLVTPEDPNYEYRREYAYDGQFRLPAGTYLITTGVQFNVGSHCTGEAIHLRNAIIIDVGDPEPTPSMSPTPTPSAEPGVAIECIGAGTPVTVVDDTGLVEGCRMIHLADLVQRLTVTNPDGDLSRLRITSPSATCIDSREAHFTESSGVYRFGIIDRSNQPPGYICTGLVFFGFDIDLRSEVDASKVAIGAAESQPTPSQPVQPSEVRTIDCPDEYTGAGPVRIEDHTASVIGCMAGGADVPVEDKVTLGTDSALLVTWMAPCAVDPLDTRIELWYREPKGDPSDPSRFQPPYLLVVNRSHPTEPYACLDAISGRQARIQLEQPISPADVALFFTYDGIGADSAQAGDGANRFQLEIAADQPEYVEGESIAVTGSLLSEMDTTVTGWVHPMFGVEQLDGVIRFDWGPIILICPRPTDLTGGIPLEESASWPVSWSPDDPQAGFLDAYLRDGKLILPSGTYRFYAASRFSIGDTCAGDPVALEASIVVTVR